MLMLLRLLLLLLLLLSTSARAQTIHYVDTDANGASDGTSWADAFPDLQAALTATASGDELWVAEGTYTPTPGTDREATFQLVSGVALYGGFEGTEMSRDQRDWGLHETILSGDIGAPGTATDNSYHVVTGSGTDATAILDGFTVTGAYADGLFPRNRGGGMRNVNGSPTIRHIIFRENHARRSPDNRDAFGAGMYNESGSSPLLEDVRFERNVAGTPGNGAAGGLANRFSSSPTLRGVVFLENEAGALAGGMANESNSSPLMVDVQFIRNTSEGWTGGLDNYDDANPTLVNVVFFGNACANYGGGMTNDTNGNATLINVLFVGNVARNEAAAGAGGLQNNGSSSTLVGVTFIGNDAPDGAADGLGHRGSGSVTLRSSIHWDNGDELVDETSGGLDVTHALVSGGFASGTAIIDADPLFVRAPSPGPDALWGTSDDDYGDLRLQNGSPALDAGDAAHLLPDVGDLDEDGNTAEPTPFDLAGGPRVTATTLDLGAYEGGIAVSNEGSAEARSAPDLGVLSPNPARGPVTIPFTLPTPARVSLTVLDARGRTIARLLDERRPAGSHTLRWSTADLAAGSYLVVLHAGGTRRVRTLILT
ncbi:MAG: T9SS type A sorting domain-containing protein [Rhodothermaceae bacterium]|nr:T9SS type A sorting domain-containing protein [Rhodothermaceae bacterium]